MRSLSLFVLLAVLGVSCATSGGAPRSTSASPAASAQASSAPQQKSRLVCHTERPTGSNIAQRVCYTQEQMEESSRATQEELRRMSQQAGAQPQRN